MHMPYLIYICVYLIAMIMITIITASGTVILNYNPVLLSQHESILACYLPAVGLQLYSGHL